MAHQGFPLSACLILSACLLLSLSRHVSSAHIGATHNLAARHVAARHVATHRGTPQWRLPGRALEASDDVTYPYSDVDDDSFSERHGESWRNSHSDSDSDRYSDSDSHSHSHRHHPRDTLISTPQHLPSSNYGRERLQETSRGAGTGAEGAETYTGSETGRETNARGGRRDRSSKGEPLVQVLTYISACPDSHFSCIRPVESPVPGKPGQCVPYEPTLSDVMGSFTITWSDSPALPENTFVAVCTAVEFWTLPKCRGAKMRVVMPNLAQVLLQAKSSMGASGELLRLGYSGPWPSQASVESVACANVTTWHTGNARSLTSQSQGSEGFEGSLEGEAEAEFIPEEIVRARLAAHRISFGLTLLLAFAAAVVLLALFGILLAYTCGDTLEALVGDDDKDLDQGQGGVTTLDFDLEEGGVTAGMGMGVGSDGHLRLPSQAVMVKGIRQLIRQLSLTPGRQILIKLSQPLVGAISGQGQGQTSEPLLGNAAEVPLQEVGRGPQ